MPRTPEEELEYAAETAKLLKDAFMSLGATIRSQLNENLADANAEQRAYIRLLRNDATSAMINLGKRSEKLIDNQNKLNKGQLTSKDIQKQLEELNNKKLKTENSVNTAIENGLISRRKGLVELEKIVRAIEEGKEGLEDQLLIALKIEKNVGILGRTVKGLSKIPILGGLIESEKILEDIQAAAAKNGANRFTTALTGLKSIGNSITKNLSDPLVVVGFLIKQAFNANSQTVGLGKALGENSDRYRANMVDISRSSKDVNVTTGRLAEAFAELTQSTGFAYKFSEDQLTTQILLTKEVGLTADEAAQFQRLSVLNNKSSKEIYNSFVKGLVTTRNQLKVGIDLKTTLAEASKVTGQLAANLGYNPELIAKAVVNAKALGMTLDQAAKSGEYLLNFESSIESELKSELLLGKGMNLERARAAALMGDQVTLANELANNIGTAADFSKMNVLQQRALAESVGMTSDELSNTLRKREEALASGKSLAQINEEEAKRAIERQTAQDKFNLAIEKLSDLVGNLVAGPLGKLIDGFASIASNALVMKIAVGALLGMSIAKFATSLTAMVIPLVTGAAASATMMSALTLGIGAAAIIASIAGVMAAFSSAKKVNDGVIGPSGKILYTGAEGAIKLNDNDSIIAGTNLGNRNNNDSSAMISMINDLKSYMLKPAVAYIQGERPFADNMGRQSQLFTSGMKNQSKLA